jgi:xanthine dehydrogenase accessory factor
VKDILAPVERWLGEGRRMALATVIATERSAPRDPGTAMAVTEGLDVAGSVSGGCVEAAVIEEAAEVIRTGRSKRVTYGISDEEGFTVGLSCGGTVHILIEPLAAPAPLFARLARAIHDDATVAVATEVTGPHAGAKILLTPGGTDGGFGDPALDAAATADARTMLEYAQTGIRRFGPHGERDGDDIEVFVQTFAPPPNMYVFGATTHAAAVARLGKYLGYRVTVCDAREALATRERLPAADEIAVQWPDGFLAAAPVDRRTVICVLTHDPKFDVPLLKVALATPAGYIGVLGSRRTHEARCRKLAAEGVDEAALSRLRAPIGLDLGARTPEEVAVSIAAEVIALRYGRSETPSRPAIGQGSR